MTPKPDQSPAPSKVRSKPHAPAQPLARPRPLVAGNWKMHGATASLAEASVIIDALSAPVAADVMICPPATLLAPLCALARGTPLLVGGQDCHADSHGAHTGDVAAEMIKDAGGSAVIVGHSERRADHGERDRDVRTKAEAAHRAGLTAIVCVGETAGERSAGLTLDVVERQLRKGWPVAGNQTNTVIAYEPVWAIGTGLTPTQEDVARVHAAIRSFLLETRGRDDGMLVRILYGGSVKPSNARGLLAIGNVDGALVGGASLKAADFLGIIAAYDKVTSS